VVDSGEGPQQGGGLVCAEVVDVLRKDFIQSLEYR